MFCRNGYLVGAVSIWALYSFYRWDDAWEKRRVRQLTHETMGIVADKYGIVHYQDGRPITQAGYNEAYRRAQIDIVQDRQKEQALVFRVSLCLIFIPIIVAFLVV